MRCKFLCATLLSTVLLSVSVSGSQSVNATTDGEQATQSTATAMIYWSSTAYLVTNAYSNVTSSNNIFNDSPVVTNNAGNKGAIKVKIVNSNGAQVGSVKTIGKGKTVRLDSIPWNSGTYTLKAMAVSSTGTYAIKID